MSTRRKSAAQRAAETRVTNEERDLVFEIAGGHREILLLIGHIRIIAHDAHQVGYMDILRWLKRERLTGLALKSWITEKQRNSLLQAIAHIRMKVHSDFKVRKIYAKPI